MSSPDELREALGRQAVDRITRVKELIDAFERGDMPATYAVSRIEEVASGDGDRIVKVGGQHTPQLQSEAPARTPAARAHREFKKGASDDAVPF